MRIAIPTSDGLLCPHFGHCEQFTVMDVTPSGTEIAATQMLTPPPHEPGVLPRWLHEIGATVIIAGGMGGRARDLLEQNGITVCMGAPVAEPAELALQYLAGTLTTDPHECDHHHH